MTTLLEAAKAIQESAKKGQAAINMPLLLDLEKAIAQELASQPANTNPVVSQKTVETVDKDCDTCNNRQRRMHQEPCFSCHGYTNWEPKI